MGYYQFLLNKVMNDEAVTYYEDIIEQMTLGHQFILKHFGVKPQTAWHIDPFGHSQTNAYLFSLMGIKNFVITRIDSDDKLLRQTSKNLEFNWIPESNANYNLNLLTHVTYNHYGTKNIIILRTSSWILLRYCLQRQPNSQR